MRMEEQQSNICVSNRIRCWILRAWYRRLGAAPLFVVILGTDVVRGARVDREEKPLSSLQGRHALRERREPWNYLCVTDSKMGIPST